MAKKNKPGKFIVIEGLDGSGSTTQANLLASFLRLEGYKAYVTKEPTDNVIGGLIRGALTGVYKLPSSTLQLLFSADRGHHLQRVIEPLIADGSLVISDRYMWSTIAFGSINIDKKWLLEMQRYFRKPDLTIFLQVKPKECARRIAKDRYDIELFEEEKKLRKVWKTYLWLAEKFPRLIKIIDGEGNERDISERIISCVRPLLK